MFVITFITSISAQLILFTPVLDDPDYIVGAGADTRVFWGALMEVILVVANIGTAVVLYPIVKRQNEGVALGYVTARVLESAVIMVGTFTLLSVVTLRWPGAHRRFRRRAVRGLRGRLCVARDRDRPRVLLGAVARYLPHRQGVQVIPDHVRQVGIR